MAEELQNLLERIQKDGVDKAEAEAQTIISKAKEKASVIVKDAETKAKSILEKAEQDSLSFESRARKSLEQAARDTVLSVHEAINVTMKKIATVEINKAMSVETMKDMLVAVVKAYCSAGSKESAIEILVNADQKKEIQQFFTAKFAAEMKNGLEIKTDDSIISGFKVSFVDSNIQHDFSGTAITEAMCRLLRPHLADIVRQSQK